MEVDPGDREVHGVGGSRGGGGSGTLVGPRGMVAHVLAGQGPKVRVCQGPSVLLGFGPLVLHGIGLKPKASSPFLFSADVLDSGFGRTNKFLSSVLV